MPRSDTTTIRRRSHRPLLLSLLGVAALGLAAAPRTARAQTFTQQLAPFDNRATWFGNITVMDGNTLVVGDPQYKLNDAASHCPIGYGAVSIFQKSGATWNFSQSFTYPAGTVPGTETNFGRSVALRNNVLAVLAERQPNPANSNTGAIYVYRRTSATAPFAALATLFSPDPNEARLGTISGVASNGTYIAAGSLTSGKIYVWQIQGNNVVLVSQITPPNFVRPSTMFITDSGMLVADSFTLATPLAYQLNGTQFQAIALPSLTVASESAIGVPIAGNGNSVAFIRSTATSPTTSTISAAVVTFANFSVLSTFRVAFPLAYNTVVPRGVALAENQGFFVSYPNSTDGQRFVAGWKFFNTGNTGYSYGGLLRPDLKQNLNDTGSFGQPNGSPSNANIAFNGTDLVVGDPSVPDGAADSCSQGIPSGAAFVFQPSPVFTTGVGSSTKLQTWMNQSGTRDLGAVATTNGEFVATGAPTDTDAFAQPINVNLASGIYGEITLYRNFGGQWLQVDKYIDGWAGRDGLPPTLNGFGASVDMNDVMLVIGAPQAFNPTPAVRSGSVYYAANTNGTFAHGPLLPEVPSSGLQVGDNFGTATTLNGTGSSTTLVVGADGMADGGSGQGFLTVDTWNGSAWTFKQRINQGGTAINEGYAEALDSSGDNLIVGIPLRSSLGRTAVGAVQIFNKSSGSYVSVATFDAPTSLAQFSFFGQRVAITADFAAVGTSASAVFFYKRVGTGWVADGSTSGPGASFTGGMAMETNSFAVGSPARNQVARFERFNNTWNLTHTMTGPTNPTPSGFGSAIDIRNSNTVIGHPDAFDGFTFNGGAFVLNFFSIQ